MPRRRGHVRWGRIASALAALALLAAGGTVLGLYASRGGLGDGPTTTTTAPSTHPRETSTTLPPPKVTPDGTYQVATTTFDARTTGAPVATPGAQLATTVWYPAQVAATGRARPDRAHGPYPLLVFSQGYLQDPEQYRVLLTAWASAGFVVAAPTYPHTDPSPPSFADEGDIVNHPVELRTVIAAVLTAASHPGSDIAGLVDPAEVGLVGQSDGGDVSLAVAADSSYRYPVEAVVVLSGAELSGFGGQYFTTPTPPLLVVQGSADTVNNPDCSVEIYDDAPAPKWYLDLLTAPHLTPYTQTDAYERVVAAVTTDFFDAELAGQPAALQSMAASGTVAGVAQLSDGATAPPATGGCPGAP